MESNEIRTDIEKFESMLMRMADDTQLNEDYLTDPRGVLSREGIQQETIDVLVSGNVAEINNLYQRASISILPKIYIKIYEH